VRRTIFFGLPAAAVYRARVLEKLQLSNNAELTVYAIRNSLV
jgi:DNA-binding NarL/FixJ family response regulator